MIFSSLYGVLWNARINELLNSFTVGNGRDYVHTLLASALMPRHGNSCPVKSTGCFLMFLVRAFLFIFVDWCCQKGSSMSASISAVAPPALVVTLKRGLTVCSNRKSPGRSSSNSQSCSEAEFPGDAIIACLQCHRCQEMQKWHHAACMGQWGKAALLSATVAIRHMLRKLLLQKAPCGSSPNNFFSWMTRRDAQYSLSSSSLV